MVSDVGLLPGSRERRLLGSELVWLALLFPQPGTLVAGPPFVLCYNYTGSWRPSIDCSTVVPGLDDIAFSGHGIYRRQIVYRLSCRRLMSN